MIIPNTADVQSVDYLSVGRSMFCNAVLTTRFPWVYVRLHRPTRSHRVSWAHVRLYGTKNFQKISHEKTSQYPWLGEQIRNWPSLKDLALSWWISARSFDAGEICEFRLHTVTCLASLYVGKQYRTNNEPQNRIKWRWVEPRLHRKSNNIPKVARVQFLSLFMPIFLRFNNYIEAARHPNSKSLRFAVWKWGFRFTIFWSYPCIYIHW